MIKERANDDKRKNFVTSIINLLNIIFFIEIFKINIYINSKVDFESLKAMFIKSTNSDYKILEVDKR